MSDDILRRLDQHEKKLEHVDGLHTEVALCNERQKQQIAETKRTHTKIDKLCETITTKHEQYDQTLYKGTDKDDAHDVRIARLEGFRNRAARWGSWILGLIGSAIALLFGWMLTKNN